MSDSLRLVTAEDLLPHLPEGYTATRGLLQGEAEHQAEGDETPVELARRIDDWLRTCTPELGGIATVPIQLVSRSFDRQQVGELLRALAYIKGIFAVRRAATYQLDVILLMHNLWEDLRDGAGAQKATLDCVRDIAATLQDLDGVAPRMWMLDGQAADGRIFTIEDVSPVVRQFEPQLLPSNLLVRPAETSFYSFGARSIWFPKEQVLEYLGTRCQEQVFEHEQWVDGITIPYATVASECADFIQSDVGPIISEMDFDPATKERIVPQLRRPSLDADRAVQGTLDDMRKVVDDLERTQLERIQVRLVENRETALEKLKAAFTRRVDRQLDEREQRVSMSLAFLELITTSSAAAAGNDRIDMGRPWTLRQAFADAFAFFDEVVGYDPSLRESVTRTQQRLDEQRRNLDVLGSEIAVAGRRVADGDEAAQGELEALEYQVESCAAEIEATREQLVAARKAVKEQDWDIIRRREDIGKQLLEKVSEEASAAGDRVGERASETDDARAAFNAAEKAWKEARSGTLKAIAWIAGILLLVGFLVSWLVPPLLDATTRQPPYLWLIHTRAGATLFNIWVIVILALALILVWRNLMAIRHLKREMDERKRQLDSCRASLLVALNGYWDAYSKRFVSRCEWIRSAHVFDSNRELEVFVDDLHDRLEAFLDDLRDARADAQDRADEFRLRGTLTEEIVVDMAYVDGLRADKSRQIDQFAREFLKEDRHHLSRYFVSGVDAMRADILGDGARRIFPEVQSMKVIEVMGEAATVDVAGVAGSIPIFLPLKPATRVDSVTVVQGPGPEAVLMKCVESLAPLPAVIVSRDDERMLLLKIAHDIDPRNVTILGEDWGRPRSRGLD